MEFKNKTMVITGAAGGLGREMAKTLAMKRANLALLDLDMQKLLELEDEIASLGFENQINSYLLDVCQEQAVETTFNQIKSDFGRIDVVINNAGILKDGLLIKANRGEPTEKMSLEQFQQVIDVNLTGVFLVTREASLQMLETGGVIINMSSVARSGNAGQTNYSAAKAGVAAMTVTWSKELARYHIRVVAIAPGAIDTEMTASMKPAAKERLKEFTPVRRMGEAKEIAKTVQFIIDNDFVNGRVIEVDGGLRM